MPWDVIPKEEEGVDEADVAAEEEDASMRTLRRQLLRERQSSFPTRSGHNNKV